MPQPSRYPREPKHPDQRAHGTRLQGEFAQLRAIFARRRNVLGVEPENVMVMRFSSPPQDDDLRRANLRVLEWQDDRVVVTSPGDPAMSEFAARLDKYRSGRAAPSAEQSTVDEGDDEVGSPSRLSAPYQAFFDTIEEVRDLEPADVMTRAVIEALARAQHGDVLRLDVQLWCPEDRGDAQGRHDATIAAVKAAGGVLLDQSLRHASGLSLLRVEVAATEVERLAAVPHVRRMDRLPRAELTYFDARSGGDELLPPVLDPGQDAPLIAVVDSGVRSGHPLIRSAFVGGVASGGLDGEVDGAGHGTFVASLALFGSLEGVVTQRRTPVRPAGRLLSVRVLDDNANFPDDELWENELIWALDTAVAAGARVVNLSLGDSRRPYMATRPTPLAAAVDEFVREHGIVVVISTGNMFPGVYDSDADTERFTDRLLGGDDAGLLDPATSALSLTVGALGADEGQGVREAQDSVDVLPFGSANVPSPLTRRGPGAANMIKPELVTPGGHLMSTGVSSAPQPKASSGVLGAEGRSRDRLLTTGSGSSFAAPLVTHAVARALGANAGLSGRAARALVLSSVEPVKPFLDPPSAKASERERLLTGYGRPDAERASYSTDHRVVLLAEEQVPVNGVHLFSVPVPDSFFESGGWRRLSVALAFDPLTRSTRLDYLSTRMQMHVYRRVSVQQVADAYLLDRQVPHPPHVAESESGESRTGGPASLSALRIDMQPTDTARAKGAHLFASRLFKHRLKPEEGEEFVIAVQNLNSWRPEPAVEPYALAVVLERDRDHAEMYAQLQAALQVDVEVPVELEF